jgi:glucose-1-phosphate adenylyltransferase
VAAIPVPVARASEFGIIEANENGEVLGFQEKPHKPRAMSSDPNRAYASMGIYLFDRNVLSRSLEETVRSGGTDFGHHLIPRLIGKHRVYAYDFSTNTVPGIKPYEETGYWRDLGTIDSYFAAHQDVLGEEPRFDAFNPQWPIYSSNYQGPVARIMGGTIDNSLFGSATVVHRATIRNSIIRREAVIEPGVLLEDCVIMDYVRVSSGSSLRRVIVDRHNVIQANTRIGYDRERDRNEYYVSPTGLVVVPHGNVTYYARDSRGAGPGYIE